MADDRTKEARSETMRRVKGRDTSCEVLLRLALHKKGLRYRLGSTMKGKPDLVFLRAKVVVFVDGCFWHGCPKHGRTPSSNREYWQAKIERNKARDALATAALSSAGWRVVRIWEHAVLDSPARCAARVEKIVRRRTPSR